VFFLPSSTLFFIVALVAFSKLLLGRFLIPLLNCLEISFISAFFSKFKNLSLKIFREAVLF